jgi:hypothetical protein
MKVAALLLAVFLGKGEPIELWLTPLPDTLAKIRLTKGPGFYAPTRFYFKNLEFGCRLAAKDPAGILDCRRSVEEIAGLSALTLAEALHADALRNWSLRAQAEAASKAAQANAARAGKLYDALLGLYPILPMFGNLPKKIEA